MKHTTAARRLSAVLPVSACVLLLVSSLTACCPAGTSGREPDTEQGPGIVTEDVTERPLPGPDSPELEFAWGRQTPNGYVNETLDLSAEFTGSWRLLTEYQTAKAVIGHTPGYHPDPNTLFADPSIDFMAQDGGSGSSITLQAYATGDLEPDSVAASLRCYLEELPTGINMRFEEETQTVTLGGGQWLMLTAKCVRDGIHYREYILLRRLGSVTVTLDVQAAGSKPFADIAALFGDCSDRGVRI